MILTEDYNDVNVEGEDTVADHDDHNDKDDNADHDDHYDKDDHDDQWSW